jgi:hypothetical protein
MTAAHRTVETFRIACAYPEHEPRESDPHYHVFHETRRRLKRLGALKCWIDNADCQGNIELHHSLVEFSLANIVDVDHFRALYPEFHVESDDAFLDWINGEGNLLPLCSRHHVGILGIHTIHYPAWVVQRVMKAGVTAPEQKLPAVAVVRSKK